mgnify:CR=1 FL=1
MPKIIGFSNIKKESGIGTKLHTKHIRQEYYFLKKPNGVDLQIKYVVYEGSLKCVFIEESCILEDLQLRKSQKVRNPHRNLQK